jgi:hypothetical protein
MPETTPFTALGRGNGFSFCPRQLAVEPVDGILPISISDYNATYGATYGFLSASSNNFSSGVTNLTDLMAIYYNLYSFNVTATGSYEFLGGPSDSHTWTDDLAQVVEKEPINRVCTFSTPNYRYNGSSYYDYGNFKLNGSQFFYDDGAGNKTYYAGAVSSSSFFRNTGVTNFGARTFESVDAGQELTHHKITISGVELHFSFYAATTPDSYSSTLTVNSVDEYTYPT